MTHEVLLSIHVHALKLLKGLGPKLGPDQDMLAILDRARGAVTSKIGPDHGKVVIAVRLMPSLSERYELFIGLADDPDRPAWTIPAVKGMGWTDLDAARSYGRLKAEYQALRVATIKGQPTASDEDCHALVEAMDAACAPLMGQMRRLVTEHQEPMTVLHA